MAQKYIFENPLIEGLIQSRPNRFIMYVELAGSTFKAHCPVTGRVGNIKFKDIPCLLSESNDPERKTKYTVEAISVDALDSKSKSWIGINQNKSNKYVEFFIKTEQLERMVKNGSSVCRERKLGKSRIDFQVKDSYIEVKTTLNNLPTPDVIKKTKPAKFDSYDRLIKHFKDLSESLKHGNRAIVLLCFMYDAKPFKPPKTNSNNIKIKNAVDKASLSGVENWQINLKIDKSGVELIDYFKLVL